MTQRHDDDVISEAITVLRARLRKNIIGNFANSDDVANYLKLKLALREREYFGILCFDKHGHLLKDTELFAGGRDDCGVYPREVIKSALNSNADGVVIYHNHPQATCEPSNNDLSSTSKLLEAFKWVDVKLVDHIIVAGGNTFSFRNAGIIK